MNNLFCLFLSFEIGKFLRQNSSPEIEFRFISSKSSSLPRLDQSQTFFLWHGTSPYLKTIVQTCNLLSYYCGFLGTDSSKEILRIIFDLEHACGNGPKSWFDVVDCDFFSNENRLFGGNLRLLFRFSFDPLTLFWLVLALTAMKARNCI